MNQSSGEPDSNEQVHVNRRRANQANTIIGIVITEKVLVKASRPAAATVKIVSE